MRTRTIKKKTRTLKQTLIIYAIGSVLCIYFGFLCGAVWMDGNDFNEFFNAFVNFILIEGHYIVGVTHATPIFIGIYWVGFSLAFILIFTKIEHPYAGEEYGVAKWGDAKVFTKEFANHDDNNKVVVNTGDVVLNEVLKVNTKNYWLAEDVYLSIDNVKTTNLNMLVVGPPGSGKSFRLARPLLSNLCGNFIVTDPKGELYKQTGQYFEDNGYEVMVMNVESEESMPMSIHFNPFKYIRNESDVLSISSILMKSSVDESMEGNLDQFFEQSAETLLSSIIYLIHYYYPKDKQNWKTFVDLLNATTVYANADGTIKNQKGGILDIARRANSDWKANHDEPFPGYMDIEKYYNGAFETTSSIVASLDAHCRYMKLQCCVDLLSDDEIQIKKSFGYSRPSTESSTGKRILYIVTSEDKRYYDWIPSMVYSLFFDELYHLTAVDESLHETLPQHLTFLMDEFANVTLPDSFVEKLSTMRSRNMSAVIIVQNLIQLKRKFPKHDMDKDLIGNCAIIDILGAPDMDSCEYLSKHFGTQTIHKASDSDAKDYKGQSTRSEDVMEKPLLSAEDIFAMTKDGECAIVVKGTDPLYQTKCQMQDTPFVKLLCRKANPYDPKKRIAIRKRKKANNGAFVYSGKVARAKKEELTKEGVEIVRLSMDDATKLYEETVPKRKEKVSPPSRSVKAQLNKNREEYLKKLSYEKPLDFSIYKDKDESIFKERAFVVQKLIAKNYTRPQLEVLHPLIMKNMSAEEIVSLMPPETSYEQMENFIKIIA